MHGSILIKKHELFYTNNIKTSTLTAKCYMFAEYRSQNVYIKSSKKKKYRNLSLPKI